MTPDIIGICVTIGVSVVLAGAMIGLAVFFGFHTFTSNLSDKGSKIKDAIIGELSPIKDRLVTIDERTLNIWQHELAKTSSPIGTAEKYLTNFGKTTITAEPGKEETAYTIQVEKGTLNSQFIGKISEETRLNSIEIEMFGKLVVTIPIRNNRLRLIIPSTDPKICTQYISIFLKWLDSEYIKALPQIDDFETGIEI